MRATNQLTNFSLCENVSFRDGAAATSTSSSSGREESHFTTSHVVM